MGPSVDVRALSALFSECEMSSLDLTECTIGINESGNI